MRIRPSRSPAPLRCELHAHTTWSDGRLTPDELVDLYGQDGFDVLCITDHVLRTDDPAGPMVDAAAHRGYLEAVERAAARAAGLYRMLVLPGLELTYWHDHPDQAVHAVAVGLRRFVAVDDGPREAMREARAAGAAIIAAHPHGAWSDPVPGRTTRGVFCDPDRMRDLVDRYELVNRHDVFGWVARERLPAVASGDAHGPEHLHTWKTLLPCERSEAAVIAYLRSDGPAYLTHPRPATAAWPREPGLRSAFRAVAWAACRRTRIGSTAGLPRTGRPGAEPAVRRIPAAAPPGGEGRS